ncbi:hypothetical protein DPSP01_007589 [Paraphaeosphaeria sporulosa]|uniref:Uncharacterized protein n=1 Tax=Paraphaeosphaeria sporulosa TaxID=1460663 RepID=A0A177C6N7_9PLEO|nr:uncharacterized protein CC84DRAFT_1261273 [Paraphaeosphaeria sporulosa]OAG02539.1 hypothetical protein CC84DRAFT_1261273 [Paraphaeosphaeria sporulosa]
MAEQEYKLPQEQIDHFLEHGWIKLSGCFTREKSAELQSELWTRLGMDPNDMSTWDTKNEAGRVNMPIHRYFPAASVAPKAWAAIGELLGGESNINDSVSSWKDSFIVNVGTPQGAGKYVKPQDLTNWHVDGDFFVHYLDSPEQALLVIPLWSDIVPNGGGTIICPAGIPIVAKHLYDHPEGVSPRMTSRYDNPTFKSEGSDLSFYINIAKQMPDEAFVEVTGEVGDVYLLHPLMLHSASNNTLRKVRVITNPPVSVKEPFNFNRADGQYNVVEQKTLKALGKENLGGWKITAERQLIVPDSAKVRAEMKRLEEERLAKMKGVQVKAVEVGSEA